MATGRGNYLTKQTGEYIVAAELSRRGFVATTFTGNVPWYDIVAVDGLGGHALVQVKAIAADSWQLNVGQFADVAFEGHKQIIKRQLDDPYPNLICVMVRIAPPDSGRVDQFFILPWRELGRIVIDGHSRFWRSTVGFDPEARSRSTRLCTRRPLSNGRAGGRSSRNAYDRRRLTLHCSRRAAHENQP